MATGTGLMGRLSLLVAVVVGRSERSSVEKSLASVEGISKKAGICCCCCGADAGAGLGAGAEEVESSLNSAWGVRGSTSKDVSISCLALTSEDDVTDEEGAAFLLDLIFEITPG